MKYKAMHGNKGVEKALEIANKFCQSDLLKVRLSYLKSDMDEVKREISKKKRL